MDFPRAIGEASEPEVFPVRLICPVCGQPVRPRQLCAVTQRPCVHFKAGIPRLYFDANRLSEGKQNDLQALVDRAAKTHWREALQECRGHEALTTPSLRFVRADFLHVLPWQGIDDVLDVGAGVGLVSCDAALYAKRVIALEPVQEYAEFLSIRARQEQLPVFPIVASPMEIPFEPASFDLITLNGTFEDLGSWASGDPEDLQRAFLARAFELLRPGGLLYIGTETRFSLPLLRGKREHSRSSIEKLLPRAMTGLYARIARRGRRHVVRTTHTTGQYRKMLQRAGFEQLIMRGAYEGYDHQRALYDIHDHRGRTAILTKLNPPASITGSLRRFVTDNRLTYRALEHQIVILGSKESPAAANDSMLWSLRENARSSVVQVNGNFKVMGVLCDSGVPVEVLESDKAGYADTARRLERSFDFLQKVNHLLGDQVGAFQVRWPVTRGRTEIAGRTYRRYEYVSGDSLTTLLLPGRYEERTVFDVVSRAVKGYLELCGRLTGSLNEGARNSWSSVQEDFALVPMGSDIKRDIETALDVAKANEWPLSVVHGDLSASNLMYTSSGKLVLIDWEHFRLAYSVGADLVRFLLDATMDSWRLPEGARRRFIAHLHSSVAAALSSAGYQPIDYPHLQALYIGQQILALGGEERTYAPLLSAYRERRALLDDWAGAPTG
jgi:SAM-dependent methyltransferase